jgi:hypothetical protein
LPPRPAIPEVVVDEPELATDIVVDVLELVAVAGGSTTVMVWAALVIGVPVLSVAVAVSAAVGRP